MTKVTSRADVSRNYPGNFAEKVRHYKTYAFSTLGYHLQFAPPPPELVKHERRALQRLTVSPWQAVPTSALFGLPYLHINIHLPSAQVVSQAARLRLALTSAELLRIYSHTHSIPDDLDVRLQPATAPWHFQTSLHHTHAALTQFHTIRPTLRHNPRQPSIEQLQHSLTHVR